MCVQQLHVLGDDSGGYLRIVARALCMACRFCGALLPGNWSLIIVLDSGSNPLRVMSVHAVGHNFRRSAHRCPLMSSCAIWALLLVIIRDSYYYSRDYYCRSLVILVLGFSQMVAGQHLQQLTEENWQFFQIDVQVIIIDLIWTSSHYTYHGDEKSGSTVLFLFHFVGLDLWVSDLSGLHRKSRL